MKSFYQFFMEMQAGQFEDLSPRDQQTIIDDIIQQNRQFLSAAPYFNPPSAEQIKAAIILGIDEGELIRMDKAAVSRFITQTTRASYEDNIKKLAERTGKSEEEIRAEYPEFNAYALHKAVLTGKIYPIHATQAGIRQKVMEDFPIGSTVEIIRKGITGQVVEHRIKTNGMIDIWVMYHDGKRNWNRPYTAKQLRRIT